jgi:NitT/TauT family transport system substrate-binding protein
VISFKKNELNIGHLSTAYHTNFLLMDNPKFNQDLNIQINWRQFGTGPAMVAAFKKKELDAGYMGLPPAVIGIEQGVPIKCVAGGHVEGTIMVAKKDFKSDKQLGNLLDVFQQFKGKKIGTPSKGSIHDVILNHNLEKFNFVDEIEVKNYKQAELIALDMEKGKLNAGVGTPALFVFAKSMFDCHLTIHPDNLWENNPSYGVFFHQDIINNRQDLVKKFLKWHKWASQELRISQKDAAEKISKIINVATKEYIYDVLGVSPKYCIALSDGYISSTMKFIESLFKLNYIKRILEPYEIFDRSQVDVIHPEENHY